MNTWNLDEIRNDLKAGRVHHPAARLCWCQPGHWYPQETAERGSTVLNSVLETRINPTEEEADLLVIREMPNLESAIAASWVRCIQNARQTRLFLVRPPEPEGVMPLMLYKLLKTFADNDTTPNFREWARIKSLASTVISFWANGYANRYSEKFGVDLRLAKIILAVRDGKENELAQEPAETPFDKNSGGWRWIRNTVRSLENNIAVVEKPVPGRIYCAADGGDSCC